MPADAAPARPDGRADAMARMRELLQALDPVVLDFEDQSARHAGHAGAREGGHFHLTLSSPRFAGRTPIERHRMVYECLGDLRALGVHALSMTLTPPRT